MGPGAGSLNLPSSKKDHLYLLSLWATARDQKTLKTNKCFLRRSTLTGVVAQCILSTALYKPSQGLFSTSRFLVSLSRVCQPDSALDRLRYTYSFSETVPPPCQDIYLSCMRIGAPVVRFLPSLWLRQRLVRTGMTAQGTSADVEQWEGCRDDNTVQLQLRSPLRSPTCRSGHR